jgi:hypothetical protein
MLTSSHSLIIFIPRRYKKQDPTTKQSRDCTEQGLVVNNRAWHMSSAIFKRTFPHLSTIKYRLPISQHRNQLLHSYIRMASTTQDAGKPPFPPFALETAQIKVKAAQDLWNTRWVSSLFEWWMKWKMLIAAGILIRWRTATLRILSGGIGIRSWKAQMRS